jgi:ABC-type uncharacterized transport system substrate-binding protein
MNQLLARFAILTALLLSVAMPASAHPHVFVDARIEVIFDGQGRVSAVQNIWQFDAAFSVFATEGLDTDGDGKLSSAERRRPHSSLGNVTPDEFATKIGLEQEAA